MWFHYLLRSWKAGVSRSRRSQPRAAHRGTRLTLEQLEDRCLPSSYSAATASQLIADIKAANAAGGANTITLTHGLYGAQDITGNDNLTIVGNGSEIRGGAYPFIVESAASLTLENLYLVGFHGGVLGGAVHSEGALTLSAVTVQGNSAAVGGAIYSIGSLTLENGTLFEDNSAASAEGSSGGAVYIGGGTANISNTTFEVNSATEGGAVYIAYGTANISNTTFESNFATGAAAPPSEFGYPYSVSGTPALGGALYVASGQVVITNTRIIGNQTEPASAGSYGGGVYVGAGSVYIDPFTVANTINNTDASGTNGSTANIDGTYVEFTAPVAGQPPVVLAPATAIPSFTTANLSVLAIDGAGAASLTYAWAVTSAPAGAATPTLSTNGSNASQNTTAIFYQAGTYTFQVTITDPSGLTAVSSVTVTVLQTVSSISTTPGNMTVADGARQQFTAVALDQFGQAMASQPRFTWQVSSSSGGTISSTGLYTAPKKGTGTFEVEVSADGLNAAADVTVIA